MISCGFRGFENSAARVSVLVNTNGTVVSLGARSKKQSGWKLQNWYFNCARIGGSRGRRVRDPGIGRSCSNRTDLNGVGSKDVVPAVAAVAPLIIISRENFRSGAEAVRNDQNKLIVGRFRLENN